MITEKDIRLAYPDELDDYPKPDGVVRFVLIGPIVIGSIRESPHREMGTVAFNPIGNIEFTNLCGDDVLKHTIAQQINDAIRMYNNEL